MDARLAELVSLLELEALEVNIFRGNSRDIGSPQVYGGQVLGQALGAAARTVPEDRGVHSLHAYFLRRGDFNAPIIYFVERTRDGNSFSSRRVTAIQHGEQIFNLSASFHQAEQGFEHQESMPEVAPPEALHDSRDLPEQQLARLPEKVRERLLRSRPFEFRFADSLPDLLSGSGPPSLRFWIRAIDRLPPDAKLHNSLLAYVSDYNLLAAALRPHGLHPDRGNAVIASIDHAMWFHRPIRVDEWFLYTVYSPNAAGARGFSRGAIYARDGALVASMAQEGLMRVAR